MPKGSIGTRKQFENMNQTHTSSSLRFVSEANFESQVLQSRSALLVAFWAPREQTVPDH